MINENENDSDSDNDFENESDSKNSNAVNVDINYFEKFWDAYPKKVGKKTAEQSFIKLKVDDDLLNQMLVALEIFKKSEQWTKENGQYIPNPSTWLNQARWTDDLTAYKSATNDKYNVEQDYSKGENFFTGMDMDKLNSEV